MVFSAEASLPPPVPTVLSIVSGDNQSGLTGEALVNPFVVEVQDQNNAPMGGVAVTFAVSKGSGSLSPETGLTAANGQAESQVYAWQQSRHEHSHGQRRRNHRNRNL